MINALHLSQIKILESGDNSRLSIKKIDSLYYLIIMDKEAAHVYVNRFGKRVEYQHDWQIKNWLKERFGIEKILIAF